MNLPSASPNLIRFHPPTHKNQFWFIISDERKSGGKIEFEVESASSYLFRQLLASRLLFCFISLFMIQQVQFNAPLLRWILYQLYHSYHPVERNVSPPPHSLIWSENKAEDFFFFLFSNWWCLTGTVVSWHVFHDRIFCSTHPVGYRTSFNQSSHVPCSTLAVCPTKPMHLQSDSIDFTR